MIIKLYHGKIIVLKLKIVFKLLFSIKMKEK